MAKGFDDLIEFLLEEIALRGEQGASTSDFKDLIRKFYAEQDSDVRPGGRSGRDAASTQHADRRLQEKVWIWLTAHPDICLNGDQSAQIPSLAEFEALESQAKSNPVTEPPAAGEDGAAASAEDATPKLFVSEERMWMAMTGHGVDPKRIPRHEFIILSIIAAHGEKGVVQPEITRISGQDKRSVPKRTDNLAKHGYITKVHVLAKGTRTSLCTLKRYAKTQRQKKAALPPIHARSTPDEIKAVIFQDGLLLYDKFFDILMNILQDCKIVTIEDCKRKLGITTKTWEMKSLWRSMRRLEGLGLVKKVKAQIKGYAASQKWYRCIKMVREPTQRDRMIFVTMSMKEAKKHKRETEAGADEDAEGDLDPDEEVEEAGASQALVQQESDVQEIKRLPPQWDPDRPVINLLWDIIRATGHSGATTAVIRDHGLGTFYRRPIDAILGRISDIWHISQPPHLRHFAIIRDTGQSDKYLHYVYRTYGNFQLAVDVGEAAWEVVITQPVNMNPGKKPRAKNQKNVRETVHREYGELDEWGFPKIHESCFEGRNGMGTLKDANKSVMANLKPLPSRGYMPAFITGGYTRSQREVSVDSDDDFPPASSRKKSAAGVDKPKRKYARRSTNGPGPSRKRKSLLNQEIPLTPEQTQNTNNNNITTEDATEAFGDMFDGNTDNHGAGAASETPPAKRTYKRRKLNKPTEEPDAEVEKRQPGVYVNPDWGKKPRDPTAKGRPKKAKVVVIVMNTLKGLDIGTPDFTAKVADAKARSDAHLQEARSQAAARQKQLLSESLSGANNSIEALANSQSTSIPGVDQPISNSASEQTPSADTQAVSAQAITQGHEPRISGPTERMPALPLAPQDLPRPSNSAEPPIFHMLDEMPSTLSSTPVNRPNADLQAQQLSPATSIATPGPLTQTPSAQTPATAPKKRGRARKDPNAPPKPRKSAKKNTGDTATASAANGGPTQQLLSAYLKSPAPTLGEDSAASASAAAIGALQTPKHDVAPENQTLSGVNLAEDDKQSPVANRPAEEADAGMPAPSEDDTLQDAPSNQGQDNDALHPPLETYTPKEAPENRELLTESQSATDPPAPPPEPSAVQDEQMPALEEEAPSSVPFKRQKGKWAGGKKQGVKLSGGGILNFNRTKLLVSIIEKCGGVFPGDFEIHRPFVGTWNKEYGAERQVDRDTIKRTIKNAIESCKVRRFAYTFKNKNGVMTTRHILTLPSIAQSDPLVLDTQKKVIAAWPRVYTPPQMKEYEEEIGNSWYGDKYEKDTSVRVERSNLPPWMRDMELRTAENQRKRDEERARKLEREAKGIPRLPRPGRGRGGRGRGGTPRPILTGRTGRKRLAGLPRPAADPDDDPWNPFQARYLRPYDSEDDENVSEPTTPTRTRSFSEMSSTFQVDNFIFHRPTHDSALASDSDDSSMFGTPFSSRSGTPVPEPSKKRRRRRSTVSSVGSTDGAETPGRLPTFQVNLSPSQSRRGSVASVDSSASISSFRIEKPRPTEWSFKNAGPDTYDATWNIQDITTLTDPDILFYPHTGTFSTEYYVVRDARLSLWVQPQAQHQQEFEDSMPRSLEEMKDSIKMKGKERDHNRRGNANLSKFERELIVVSHWEDQYLRKNEDLGLVVRQPHFINHNYYGDQEEPENEWTWSGLKWGDLYSQAFTPFEPPSFDETDESDAPDGFIMESGKRRRGTDRTGGRATKRRRRTTALDILEGGASEPRRRQKGPRPSKTHLARAPTQDPLCVISTADTKRLLYAMVVVQSLLGGIEGYTSWDQIRKIFRTHERWDLTSFRNRWVWLKTRCAEVVENLFDEFQQAYLLAYECGDIPPINYDNVEEYDWDGIVKWTMQNISIRPPREVEGHADLPTTRKELEDAFVIHEVNEWSGPPKESLYNEGCLSTRRKELTQQYSFYLPLTSRPKPKEKSASSRIEQKVLERAKTWVRAAIMAPEEQFDTESFGEKLKTIDEKTLNKATSELVSTKYFRDEQKGRTRPGRNYGVDRTFPKAFERQLLPVQLMDAMQFKKDLDDAFASGAPAYTISNAAKDGHILAIINLAQSGLVRINTVFPPTDHTIGNPFPRMTKWGFTEGHYKTVQMDRRRVTWPLEIVPTDKYVHGNLLLKAQGLEALPPPPLPVKDGEHDGFVPLWADLFSNTIWEWWHRVVTAVLHVVFGRPGIGVEGIGKALKDAMGEWEIELCLAWLMQVGAVEEMRVGLRDGEKPRGWRLGEWWWCVLVE
ncbi:Transcription factor tau subunit sfc3 [Lasiodiplodia theobromae]|uniref:Transcription factor tau subunit sfc3 n=1 Tax=Lasiodiplodia theobromae TaxID=45133 RepID=A0A5N5DFW8_9PEZI|nr:Transcription factor tau subunit sfc3 [Lasiodiplodia theobromae]